MPLLDEMTPTDEELRRTFKYPENDADGLTVTLQYLSPSMYADVKKQTEIHVGGKKFSDEAAFRRAINNEIGMACVRKIEGANFRKLRGLCRMKAESIAKAGGLDAPVLLDPTDGLKGIEGRKNLRYLLDESDVFLNWALNVSLDIARFQDADWEDQTKNSVSGGD